MPCKGAELPDQLSAFFDFVTAFLAGQELYPVRVNHTKGRLNIRNAVIFASESQNKRSARIRVTNQPDERAAYIFQIIAELGAPVPSTEGPISS
jgi:hypothetical protein